MFEGTVKTEISHSLKSCLLFIALNISLKNAFIQIILYFFHFIIRTHSNFFLTKGKVYILFNLLFFW